METEHDATPKMPEIPDEVWGIWCPVFGWNGHIDGKDILVHTTRAGAEQDAKMLGGGRYGPAFLVGVSPARLAACEAERDDLMAEVQRLTRGWDAARKLAACLIETCKPHFTPEFDPELRAAGLEPRS